MTAEDKQADRNSEPASGLTFQERAQKNRLDERLEAWVAEIVRAKCSEPDQGD